MQNKHKLIGIILHPPLKGYATGVSGAAEFIQLSLHPYVHSSVQLPVQLVHPRSHSV